MALRRSNASSTSHVAAHTAATTFAVAQWTPDGGGNAAHNAVGIVVLLGCEQLGQWFADGFPIAPTQLFSRILRKVDKTPLGVCGPEPTKTGRLETVEQFDPARDIGNGNRAQRCVLARHVLVIPDPRCSREETCHYSSISRPYWLNRYVAQPSSPLPQ